MKKFSLIAALLAFSLIPTPSFSGPEEVASMSQLAKILNPHLKEAFKNLTPKEQREYLREYNSYMKGGQTGLSQEVEPATTVAAAALVVAGVQVLQNCETSMCTGDIYDGINDVGNSVSGALDEVSNVFNSWGW